MSLDSPDDDITAWLRSRPRRAAMPRADRSRPLIASTSQRRLWFDHHMRSQTTSDGGTVYHSTLALRLREEVDVTALRSALESLVARHESLRTRFALASDGILHQLVVPVAPLRLHVEDCGGDDEVRRARMAGFFAADFDLERGPLLRAGLFSLTDRDHILFLVIHHIATDGWSMDLLHQELGEFYRAGVEGRTADLPELAHQYADFAAWEQSEFKRGMFADDLTFWREQLAGAPQVLAFPTGLPGPRSVRSPQDATISRFRPPPWPRSNGPRGTARRRCSRRCWPPSRCCWRAGPGSRSRSWARSRPTAAPRRPSRSSASSSTCCRCAAGWTSPSRSPD
ncbi:hypothetical protein SHKM778_48070 [Streptomyces sp. KM77-8]|uniref:Condensation domain-containing protein n=1 Tax=Streptomyces haneummycinicus TaxID=3074435 RepID=A0AAT9HLL2_9ACTN